MIDLHELLVITDYFVIATGNNDRQVKTIAEEIEKRLKEAGLPAIGREGEQQATWILLDFGDVVVHVFQPAEREYYRLEKLWGDAPREPLPLSIVNPSTPTGPVLEDLPQEEPVS